MPRSNRSMVSGICANNGSSASLRISSRATSSLVVSSLVSRRQPWQAETRAGSSTMEKRTPALWRFSSDTTRQASSASWRVLNGPCTWAEPSTSLWKFIEPNSPPITQKLLVVMTRLLLLPLAELVHRVAGAARLQGRLAGEISLVIVADIGAGHVLMLCAGDAL